MYHFESVALNSNTIYTFTFTLGEASSDDLQNRRKKKSKKDDINRSGIPSENDNQIDPFIPIILKLPCLLHGWNP